jgi:hypothetical protein
MIMSSRLPASRRVPFGASHGSKLELRSRGTSSGSGPTSDSTVSASSHCVSSVLRLDGRANYMYGITLPASPIGQVSTGLGIATLHGSLGLLPPTVDIIRTRQQETVDGVHIIFQITRAPRPQRR